MLGRRTNGKIVLASACGELAKPEKKKDQTREGGKRGVGGIEMAKKKNNKLDFCSFIGGRVEARQEPSGPPRLIHCEGFFYTSTLLQRVCLRLIAASRIWHFIVLIAS